MKTSASICLAVVGIFWNAQSVSAQVVVSPWGGVGVRIGGPAIGMAPVRSVYTGGTVTRVRRVGMGTRIGTRLGPGLLTRHVVMPAVVGPPGVVVGSHVTPVLGGVTNAHFSGDWRVYASHVDASMTLGSSGYALSSPGHHEVGVWTWQGTNNLLGGNTFLLKLRSGGGRSTTFDGQWLVPGRKFQMTSLNTGVTYTAVRVR